MHDKIYHNITKFCKNITKTITQLEFVIFSQKYDKIYEENIRRAPLFQAWKMVWTIGCTHTKSMFIQRLS
jgi:hypothetical protein